MVDKNGYVMATLPNLEGDELIRIGDGIYCYTGVKDINTNPTLQFIWVRAADWSDEECFRVSGEIRCAICGEKYWRHPRVAKEEAPSLVRGCDGRLLKL